MSTVSTRTKPDAGEPAWAIAHLFPLQGAWEEEEYLTLSTNHLIEFSDGFIEVPCMPTPFHQRIVLFLIRTLLAFVEPQELGEALMAPLRVRLRKRKYREPDIAFMLAKHADRKGKKYWQGADLVMEMVSEDDADRKRDLEIKPVEYARARIPEYWIVDPKLQQITVLRLKARKYVVHGQFGLREVATSALLDGFEVDVNAVFAAKGA